MTKNFSKIKKVAVALSGGVDSSVAAALLKKQGFEVIGFHLRLFDSNQEPLNRAKKVAQKLGIDFLVLDLRKEFRENIINYFLQELKVGRTPNPCVVCNKEIKFGLMLKKAKELGCDYLATGHYARLRSCGASARQARLLKAKDNNKDQTYFLWKLGQKELKKVLFPIGEIASKAEVRELAKKFGLPTAKTPESNDICFLANTTTNDFLRKNLGIKKGKIIDVGGRVLGAHAGLWFHTIGQRKGVGLSGGPWFVIDKDFKKNVLVVSKNEKDLLKKEIKFEQANWVSQPAKFPFRSQAKIRYGAPLANCLVYKNKAVFSKPQKAPTPGQSIVFYSPRHSSAGAKAGESVQLLGGGVII